MQVLNRDQLEYIISRMWAREQSFVEMDQDTSIRLFIVLLLSTYSDSTEDDEDEDKAPDSPNGPPDKTPLHDRFPNPCLLALQLRSELQKQSSVYSRDRQFASRLHEISTALEYIATGVLQRTSIAAQVADPTRIPLGIPLDPALDPAHNI